MLTNIIHRIVAVPLIYDLVQQLAGYGEITKRLVPALQDTSGQLVLDIGAGTGNAAALLPGGAQYIWLDTDPQKLRGFKKKYALSLAVLSDGRGICLRDKSVDVTICVDVTHHIPDDYISEFMSEISRVTRRKLIFVDPLAWNSRISRLLWKYDRGSFPRSLDTLQEALKTSFTINRLECFSVYHHYIFCEARPCAD